MGNEYKTMIQSLSVYLPGHNPIYGECNTTVSIDDEAAGMFLVLEQEDMKIQIDPEEWPYIVKAVERLLEEIKKHSVNDESNLCGNKRYPMTNS